MVPRRTFLRSLALASAAAAIGTRPAGATTVSAAEPAPSATPPLSFATFAALQGAAFVLHSANDSRQLCVLKDVQQYQRGAGIENFSLRFDGAAETALAQGTHPFEHATLGRFEVFVVAKPVDARTCGYEAVFNRLT